MAKRSQMPKTSGSSSGKSAAAGGKRAGSPLVLWAVIGAVAVIVVGVILLQVRSMDKPVATSGRVTEGSSWGPTDAPVKIVEYSDFGCTYCRAFALNQGKQLQQEYEKTGKVRFDSRSFIIEGPSTRDAANASLCAAEQGRYWDYHDVLYNKSGTGQPQVVFAKAALKGYGAQVGLDAAKFNACVDKGQYLPEVQSQHNEGAARGVKATPSFFINGKKIEGAAPYAEFKAAVDAALKASGS
ncbi:MAG: DsbA family protein [Anaerolineae bacterium]|jgi:protein-disulfide isomerase|nr:DsbA family protein [Anaerolineae bacterium]